MLDLIIRGGDLIDGSGAQRRRADVGVQGDRVVAIGPLDTEATAVIDAKGKVVTPGFIDVHTHFDAQVFWDGALTPSPFHGVTTALAGNCGFSIQPLSGAADDAEYLLRMLARVEGMPVESLRLGVPWDWRSTDEYLAAVEPKLGINAAFMVGHSAVRRLVMGTEATERTATSDEVDQMADALRRALEAGALGFSSSWARTHNDADGEMVPSRYASAEELITLSAVAGEFPGPSLEFIPMIGVFDSWAVELMTNMSAEGRGMSFATSQWRTNCGRRSVRRPRCSPKRIGNIGSPSSGTGGPCSEDPTPVPTSISSPPSTIRPSFWLRPSAATASSRWRKPCTT